MTNIFQDPFDSQDDNTSLQCITNYIAGINIFKYNNDILSWCYLYVFMFFYFWIIYLVFLLYKSGYTPRLYHADDDTSQQYCYCCSVINENDESYDNWDKDDNENVEKGNEA